MINLLLFWRRRNSGASRTATADLPFPDCLSQRLLDLSEYFARLCLCTLCTHVDLACTLHVPRAVNRSETLDRQWRCNSVVLANNRNCTICDCWVCMLPSFEIISDNNRDMRGGSLTYVSRVLTSTQPYRNLIKFLHEIYIFDMLPQHWYSFVHDSALEAIPGLFDYNGTKSKNKLHIKTFFALSDLFCWRVIPLISSEK